LRDDPDFRFDQRQEPSRGSGLRPRRGLGFSHQGLPHNGPGYGLDNPYTIFIGNLHPSVTQDELISVFRKYGPIASAQVIAKPAMNSMNFSQLFNFDGVLTGDRTHVFAFVEFIASQSVVSAIEGEVSATCVDKVAFANECKAWKIACQRQ
jgi:hypothetical protein